MMHGARSWITSTPLLCIGSEHLEEWIWESKRLMGSVRLQHGWIMSTPIFRSSDFPHNVPPLEHFQREQLSSFILLFWRGFYTAWVEFLFQPERRLTGRAGGAAHKTRRGCSSMTQRSSGLWWAIVYKLISPSSLRSPRCTIPLRNEETQSSVSFDRR